MKRNDRKLVVTVLAIVGCAVNADAITAYEGEVCEQVGALADAGTIAYHWQDKIDINNDGSLETIEFLDDGVTDSAVYRNDKGEELSIKSPIWDVSDGLFWQHYVTGGKTYRVQCRDPGCLAPSRLLFTDPGNATVEVCRFRQQFKESFKDGAALCNSLIGDNAAKYIRGYPLRPEDAKDRQQFLLPRERIRVDFDNDGKSDELIRMEIDNESSNPCSYSYFELLKSGEGSDVLQKRRALLLKLQQISDPETDVYPTKNCHGNDSGWIFSNGEFLFESKYRGVSPDAMSQFHDVTKMNPDGSVERVCQYTILQKTQIIK